MKNIFTAFRFSFFFFFLITGNSLLAQTNTFIGTGNWSIAGNWSLGMAPLPAHDVVINGGTATLNVPTTINSLTVNGGILQLSTQSITVTGTTIIDPTGTIDDNANGGINTFGVINNDGNFTTSGTTGDRNYIFEGDITNNNNFSLVGGNPKYQFNSPLTITNNAPSNGNMQFTLNLGSGTCQINTDVTIANGSSTGNVQLFGNGGISIAAGATLTNNYSTGRLEPNYLIGAGSFSNTGRVLMKSDFLSNVTAFTNSAASTFEYNYTGNGNIRGGTGVNYGNLIISGSGIKTLSGNTTVNGNLTVGTGATLLFGTTPAKTATINGNLLGAGTIDLSNAAHNLNLLGATNTIGNLNTGSSNSTVTYGGASNQSIMLFTYNRLGIGGGGVKILTGNTSASISLNFIGSPAKIALGNFNLTLPFVANVISYDNTRYIITNGTGNLIADFGGGLAIVPIGISSTSYDPISFNTSALANATYNFRVGAPNTNGLQDITSPNRVNAVWRIAANASRTLNASEITFDWNTNITGSLTGSFLRSGTGFPLPNLGSYSTGTSIVNNSNSITLNAVATEFSVFTPPTNPFITTWKTDNIGISANNQITIPTSIGTYNYDVYWEDNTNPAINGVLTGRTGATTITFPSVGVYKISITGAFPHIMFSNVGDKDKLLTIEQWGNIAWASMDRAFFGCTSLTYGASVDVPDLIGVTDISDMFRDASAFNGDISAWNVIGVTNMASMFNGATVFNQDISGWDVSNVTDMSFMFSSTTDFNQNLSSWNVSSVTTMSHMFSSTNDFNNGGFPLTWTTGTSNVLDMSLMFYQAVSFNQAVSSWNVSSVIDMHNMFDKATSFNQDLSSWNVSSVTDMSFMFLQASAFNNGDAALTWTTSTSSVTDMQGMFLNATAFNQDISSWNVGKVTNFYKMFENASAFNNGNSILNWTTIGADASVSVINMSFMFKNADAFNQNISSWNVEKVNNFDAMFTQADLFNNGGGIQPLSWTAIGTNPSVSTAVTMSNMFDGAVAFNQDISSWDVSKVSGFGGMFLGASSFNQSLASWQLRTGVTGVNMINMLDNCAMDLANYDATLIGWAAQAGVPTSVTLGATGLKYCTSATARTTLVGANSWTIIGDVLDCAFTFRTTWITTDGATPNTGTITIPTTGTGYNYNITWTNLTNTGVGDGSDTRTTNHTITGLENGSTYEISITGDFPHFAMNGGSERLKLRTIEQWGNIAWTSMAGAFDGCSNLTTIGSGAANVPDLSNVTSMEFMFQNCTNFIGNPNMANWDVSGVINFARVFSLASNFNQPLNWDVSSGTTFGRMFRGAATFNQDLNWSFNTSPLVNLNMQAMFQDALAFNGDVSTWTNTQRFDNLFFMFNRTNLNRNLGGWDISSVTNMTGMLSGSGMNQLNYDNTLIGWAAQTLTSNITLGANGRTYCAAISERNTLTSIPNNWVITGDTVNTSCLPTQPQGNKGMYFDGDDQITSALATTVTDDFTLSFWIKKQADQAGYVIYNGVEGINGYGISLSATSQVTLELGGGGSFTSDITLVTNEWTHISILRNTGTWKIYKNSILANLSGTIPAPSTPTTAFQIGKATSTSFLGQIDEVRIFTGVRDANQIAMDMATQTPNGALGYWDFETGTGTTAFNLGSLFSAADGTLAVSPSTPLWALRVTNTDDVITPAIGSLRWAINQANTDPDKDYIDFSIEGGGVQTISLEGNGGLEWLRVSKPVFLDGFSQLGSRMNTITDLTEGSFVSNAIHNIIIDKGTSDGNFIVIDGGNPSNSQIRGLQIQNFTQSAIYIQQNITNVRFTGNHFINNKNAINLDGGGATIYTVGGSLPSERNIFQSGTTGITSKNTNVSIFNNVFGLDINGVSGIGFTTAINLLTASANNNKIGGLGTNEANLLTGNNTAIRANNAGISNLTYIGNNIYCNTTDVVFAVGANNNQPIPIINSANIGTNTVSGTGINGDIIHLYRNPVSCISTSKQEYLGTTTVSGGIWSIISSEVLIVGDELAATQTNGTNGTSKFATFIIIEPEISVEGNSIVIADGDTTPNIADGTSFGNRIACDGSTIAKIFTIQNTGTAVLNITNITVTNLTDFALSALPTFPATIAVGGTQSFTVTFNPSAIGNRAATVTITNDDSDEGVYDFAISGVGDADNIVPIIITIPADVTVSTDAGFCTASSVILGTPTGTDNCGIPTITNDAPAAFPIGATTVTWTATDSSGNTATVNQIVTVVDVENPTITVPTGFTVNTDAGFCTASSVVLGTPTGTDNCGIPTITNDAPTTFPIGVTTVTWTATDASGNTATVNQTITVSDTELPVLTAQSDFARNTDLGNCSFINTDIPNGLATDNCGVSSYSYVLTGVTTGTVTDLTNHVFNVGVTTVTWTATDGSSNISVSDDFTITVLDTELPVLTALSNVSINSDVGVCTFTNTASSIPNGTATDNCSVASYFYVLSGATTGTVSTLLSQVFNLGVTTVTWTATDGSGNISASSSFTITVSDTELPVLTAQSDFARNTDLGNCSFINTDIPNGLATDNCGVSSYSYVLTGVTTGTVTDLTNHVFNVGVTTITWTATDGSGNISVSDDFTITVSDTQLPVVTALSNTTVTPNQGCTFYNTSILNPSYIADGTAIGNCGVASFQYILTDATIGTFSTLENQIFNEGATTVTWTATDVNGNISSPSTFTVTVIDSQQPPVLNLMPNFIRNTDATNCYYTNINGTRIPNGTASDNCGVASYEYILSGATILTPAPSLQGLRFNVGVTTVSWTATDRNGNVSLPNQFTVTVSDAQNPTIQAPQNITRTTNLYGCTSTRDNLNIGIPTVSDNCLFRVFNDAPAEFPIGETVVIWTAIDSAGNSTTDEQIITIEEQYYVIPSDSLILVQMYNQMGGVSWTRRWDLNTPVSTWNGITVRCGNIASINLFGNNLIGRLPSSVLGLARRTEASFSLNIGANRLDFDSAEDFVGLITRFIYFPQSNIYSSRSETIRQTESITFNSQTQGAFNNYQWYKDENPIIGATDWDYIITNAIPTDAGIYSCKVTNRVATQLTLERNPIILEVQGFLNSTDSIALVTIFEQTGGTTTWTNPWVLTNPVATWEGVTVIGDKIRELDLSSRNMTGVLPNVFDADLFSELRYLSFFDNELEGQIPVSIGALITLTYLDLDKNDFEGSVPTSFGNLINLQSLWLSRNNLTNLPDEIGNLSSLKTLYLNDNKFTQLPETIGNLGELLVLNISDNQLLNLPNSITNLIKLTQFYANRNYIVTLPIDIQNLVALTVFEINTNNLTALPNGFLQLSSLSNFRISENELEFDDLLPYSTQNYSVFDYAPQAPINDEEEVLAILNSSISFTVQTQGNGNNYQWFRDGISIATTQNFTINRLVNDDAGVYTAQVTNPKLPDLTLQRRSITLNVECQAGLNFEINQPTQTVFCENQPFGLRLEINDQFTDAQQITWRKDGIILAFASERTYTVTSAGIYTAEVLTPNGCTALSNLVEITVLPQPEISILLTNEQVLTATLNTQESVTYQWLKDGNPIENAFERTYTPTETGEYSLLILTETGCSSVSQIIIFTSTVTGIEEPKELRNLSIFPNPNAGNFFIDFGTNTPNGEPIFILIDVIGKQLVLKTERISSTRYKVETNNLTGGMYYIQIQTKDGLVFRKFVIEE